MAEDVLDVLEAAYRLDGDDRRWLDRVARAVRTQLDPRHAGVFAFFYELDSDGSVRVNTPLSYDVPPPYDAIGPAVPSGLPAWYVRQTFAQHPCGSAVHTGSTRARTLVRTQLRAAFGAIG